jgi:hypothetical protein
MDDNERQKTEAELQERKAPEKEPNTVPKRQTEGITICAGSQY